MDVPSSKEPLTLDIKFIPDDLFRRRIADVSERMYPEAVLLPSKSKVSFRRDSTVNWEVEFTTLQL